MRIEKPIIFFDLETTGVDTETSRIIEMACIKYNPDGSKEDKYILVNPEVPIPLEVSEVHGFYDDDVKDKPVFKQYAKSVRDWFYGCDLGGFNSNSFDVPLLSAEFERAGLGGIDWNPSLLDALVLYRKMHPNTLSDVYKRIFNRELDGAHGAVADITATEEISKYLIDLFNQGDVEVKLESAKDVDNYLQGDKKRFDLANKMYIDVDGVVKWNFSKNINKPVLEDIGFINWFMRQNFPKESKDKLKNLQRNQRNY